MGKMYHRHVQRKNKNSLDICKKKKKKIPNLLSSQECVKWNLNEIPFYTQQMSKN